MNNYDRVIKILRCPVCYADLYLGEEELICSGCGRRYRVVNGIIDMLQPIELDNKREAI